MSERIFEKIRVLNPKNLELELIFTIDNRIKHDSNVKTFNYDKTLEFAKKLIDKYENKYIHQSINYISDEGTMQQNFVNGEKTDELYYIKEKVLNNMYFVHNTYPSYKLSIKYENPIENFDKKKIKTIRIKNRICMELDDWRLDITQVKNINISEISISLKKYKDLLFTKDSLKTFDEKWKIADTIEFELEYKGDISDFTIEKLLIADELFEDLHETSEYQEYIYKIASYIKPYMKERFKTEYGLKQLGNAVKELDKIRFLNEVQKNITNYYITDKLDGKRAILYLHNKSYALTDEILEIKYTSSKISIIDTEFYDGSYYIFDVMVYNGLSLIDKPFEERLSYFNKFNDKLFKLKPFIKLNDKYREQIKQFKEDKKIYEVDGIILTPADGTYNDMEVFKYKPVEKLTIDFLIRRCPPKLLGIAPYLDTEKKLYLLFCGISYHAYNKSGLRLIPQYSELFNNISPSSLPGYFPIQFQSANKTFSYLYWSNEEIDSEIGEFIYKDNQWELERIRTDRKVEVNRGNYFGNNFEIAEKNWVSYSNPLVIEEIPLNSYFMIHDNPLQKATRSYNNFVKSRIISQIQSGNVMDIASGKGQDLIKYAKSGIKNLLCLEIDKDALSELNNRKYDMIKNRDFKKLPKITFHQMDMNESYNKNIKILDDELQVEKSSFDYIICNLAFHYFLSSEKSLSNIISFINAYIKPGGRFIFTAFDGKKILDLINENAEWTVKKGDEIKYSIKRLYKNSILEKTGQKVDVKLPFSDEYYSEYLVNIEHISNVFANHGFELEINKSFDEYKSFYNKSDLDSDDMTYVGLYHYYQFYKKKSGGKN